MEHHAGDGTGIMGVVLLLLSGFAEYTDSAIVWLDVHTGAVVSLTAIGGLILSCISVRLKRQQLKQNRDYFK